VAHPWVSFSLAVKHHSSIDIALEKAEGAGLQRVRQELASARAEIVVPDHRVTFSQQAINQIAADEAGRPGDERFHLVATIPRR
jgi:hypothetical protein